MSNKSKPTLKSKLNFSFLKQIEAPSYILDYDSLQYNVDILNNVSLNSGAKILLALKGYSFWREFDIIRDGLDGATCSGAYEAKLAYEEIAQKITQSYIKKDICVFSPSYKEFQMKEILKYATHIIFNSFSQWDRFKNMVNNKNIEIGLRVNPLYSEVKTEIYNPCVPKSRLGIIPENFYKDLESYSKKYNYKSAQDFFINEFHGLHFHTHCEQDSTALQRTLEHVKKHFDSYIKNSKWINFGGGHHITRRDYNTELLIKIIRDFKLQYNDIEVFLEPGEAVGWQTGDLIGEVVDIIENSGQVAILDISASCHMPDCIEMPYRPECYKISILDSNIEIEDDLGENIGKFKYRFGGPTCLAGDIIGDYSFNSPLKIGDKIAFCDMMHYTIVKNTTFNGIELPNLAVIKNGEFKILKQFDYSDFKNRN